MGIAGEPEIVGFDCKYLKSAVAEDEIQIRTWPASQSVYRFEISRNRIVLAMGSMTVATIEQPEQFSVRA
jgi:acyl-CoA thioesterase FadM